MDLSPILNPLNDAQRAAVTAPLGPVLVLAGAGSGKTRVLTHRIAWLIQAEGVSPHGILAVTFTNKAAGEMRARVERLLGVPGGGLWIGTFHGIAHRLLRLHWREANLAQGFQILDSEDQQRLIKKVIRAAELDETRWVPREVQWFINANKDEGRRPGQLKDENDPTRRQLIRLYAAYEAACASSGVVDFAELLLRAFELWRDNPALLSHYRRRFQHVLVDEFQDTNAIQYEWIRQLAAPRPDFLYLMHKEGVGWRRGSSQVYTNGQEKPMVGFKQRSAQEHADGTWIIRTHSTENDARLDEMLTSLRYGLPSLDTDSAALSLLEDVGLDPEQPHYRPRGRNSNRHNIVITLCADRRGASPMHRISVAGACASVRRILEAQGLSVRAAKHDHRSWRFETVRKDFGELMTIARRIRDELDAQLVLQGLMYKRSLPFVTASAIRPGMVVATDADSCYVVERIEAQPYTGEVYDLNIERTHNFIAGGVITHNSIYRFRGASARHLEQFRRDYPAAQLFRLEQNYRSTGTILEAANGLIAHNASRLGKKLWTSGTRGEPIRLYTAFNERDEAEFVTHHIREHVSRGGLRREIAILYRSNAQSRVFEEAFLSARVPYRVYGGLRFFERAEIKDALAYLRLIANRNDDAAFPAVGNTPTRCEAA